MLNSINSHNNLYRMHLIINLKHFTFHFSMSTVRLARPQSLSAVKMPQEAPPLWLWLQARGFAFTHSPVSNFMTRFGAKAPQSKRRQKKASLGQVSRKQQIFN